MTVMRLQPRVVQGHITLKDAGVFLRAGRSYRGTSPVIDPSFLPSLTAHLVVWTCD